MNKFSLGIGVKVGRLVILAMLPTYLFASYRNLFVEPAYIAEFFLTVLYAALFLVSAKKINLSEKTRITGIGVVVLIVAVGVMIKNQNLQAGNFWALFSITLFSLMVPPRRHILMTMGIPLLMAALATYLTIVSPINAIVTAFAGFAISHGVVTLSSILINRLEKNAHALEIALEQQKADAEALQEEKIKSDLLADEALSANAAKSDFLANVSHEIRTPLNGVFGSLQVIKSHPADTEIVTHYTDIAMQSYHSVIGIVNDILDISKISEGKISLYPEPAKLCDTVSMVASEMAVLSHSKGVKLVSKCSIKAKTGNRLIDTTRLSQILRNLLSNAVRFTDEGSVTLSVDIGVQSSEVIISVSDTGVGIPGHRIEHIFEAFEQAEASRKTERRGTGLGLTITKRLVELMQGTITVSSELGRGSCFTVTLHLPITQQPTVDQSKGEDIGDIKPARILLAEDVAMNRMIFKAILKSYPYDIEEARDGEEAVQKALSEEFDVVFMDIQMPVLDGVDALKALQAADYVKPVIACTANVMKEDVEVYLDEGFDSVIGKPYLKEDLISHIQSAVTRM